MMQIGIIDANDMLIEAELDGTLYYIGLSWNQEGQLWTFSIRDLNREVLTSGISVVPRWPLLMQVRRPELPPGEIAVEIMTGKKLGRKSFVDGSAYMYYFSPEDL